MTAKRQKEKERRRARKLAEQAWDAVNEENLQLAEKIIRRAVDTQPENPLLWNDQGMILGLLLKDQEAEDSFRSALSLAPDFAEAYAHLAAMALRQGYGNRAVSLQQQAVKHAPDNAEYAERLVAYQALAGKALPEQVSAPQPATTAPYPASESTIHEFREKVNGLDWQRLGEQLTREGCALIPQLLDADSCATLRTFFDDESLFAKTVVMDRKDFGNGVYCYFRVPIPPQIDGLRRAIYPNVAGIANTWQRLLQEPEKFPLDWEEFRRECEAAGQTTPTPILLKYGPGGFNALHRDLRGRVFFPIQMAVVLSPRAASPAATEGFEGGEFVFCDVPEGNRAHRKEVAAALGDALLFCTRDRLVAVGGACGLQPVKHGVNRIIRGTRFVLGVPFHEYR